MPGFQTKPLTIITIVSGNDFRIFPRNVMACFTHVFSQSWFWAVKIRNSPLMFFQTCAKLAFCLTQIYFLAITAWYRVYGMCFLISWNAILGFAKICPNVWKGFRATLIPQLLRTLLIGSAIPWMYGTIAKPFTAESPSGELQWVKVGRLKQS